MFRSSFINLGKIGCRSSSRNVKTYKFLPSSNPNTNTNKNPSANKESKLPPPTQIDEATAALLERISLVGIDNEKSVQILEEAIRFADQIFSVDTTKVKPLYSVLEDETLYLRDDEPKPDVTKDDLISHSSVTQENYFVTPPGNLEYIPEKKSFQLPPLKEACEN